MDFYKIFFKNMAPHNFLKNLIYRLILTPILLLGFFIAPVQAQEANHLMISAVQITEGEGKTGHDFVEIYNPTDQDISLKGYRLVKRTKIGTSDGSIKSWTDDVFIQAHSWRLWASSDDKAYSLAIGADDATTATLAADNGVAIRLGPADTGEIIDSVAWGAAENIFKEGAVPANPAASETLVRKPGNGANGEDTGNNASDFLIVNNYTPHNSGGYDPIAASPSLSPSPAISVNSSSQISSDSANNTGLLKQLVAEAGYDKEAVIGQSVLFDGSDSYDPEEKSLSYNWDFGDGAKAGGVNASHIFNSAGEFKVILKIASGARSAEDFLAVKIIEPDFSDKVILSELLPDPVGSDKDGEWIKLYNGGDKKANLKGWMLDDKTDGGIKPYIFTEDVFVEAKSFLVVPRSKSKIVLANAGGEANLLWYNGKNLSKVVYGAAKEGRSYAFISGVWQWMENSSADKENNPAKAETAVQAKKMESVLPAKTEENIVEVSGQIIKADNSKQSAEADNQILSEAVLEEGLPDKAAVGGNGIAGGWPEKANSSGAEKYGNQMEKKNNPWFWGNMALSAMSLFLVWRYQSLKKKAK